MGLGPPVGSAEITPAQLTNVMNPSDRVQLLTRVVCVVADGLDPLVDLYRPYVDGLAGLPRDGRFLLVGNHTQFGGLESVMIPYLVRRELRRRVRPLTDRAMGQMRGVNGDLLAALGGVVGHPDTASELMAHGETVLVFPGGGREIPKFKGEEYRLKWAGRSGFARIAIAHSYPIVPVGLVGGDDVYTSITSRDGLWGKLSQAVAAKLTGRADMAMPLVRGWGPTLVPSPQRTYVRFGTPIDTAKPEGVDAAQWVATVKEGTQTALETALADLQTLRSADPYRSLNPLSWHAATRPPAGVAPEIDGAATEIESGSGS